MSWTMFSGTDPDGNTHDFRGFNSSVLSEYNAYAKNPADKFLARRYKNTWVSSSGYIPTTTTKPDGYALATMLDGTKYYLDPTWNTDESNSHILTYSMNMSVGSESTYTSYSKGPTVMQRMVTVTVTVYCDNNDFALSNLKRTMVIPALSFECTPAGTNTGSYGYTWYLSDSTLSNVTITSTDFASAGTALVREMGTFYVRYFSGYYGNQFSVKLSKYNDFTFGSISTSNAGLAARPTLPLISVV